MSVHPSIRFSFPDDNLRNISGISPNLVCALILWRSGLGLLMGKFCQFFTELSVHDTVMAGHYNLTFLFVHSITFEPCMLGFRNFIYGFLMKK